MDQIFHSRLVTACFCAILLTTGCSQIPGQAPTPPQEQASGVIQLELPEKTMTANYPSEFPPADAQPHLTSSSKQDAQMVVASHSTLEETRAVWISYLEYESLLTGKSKEEFQKNIAAAFDNVASVGFNTVFLQVRPFGDALYPSQYFPWSYTITGTEGADPGFDPLKIMLQEAKARNLKTEAWINPYRVRTGSSNKPVSQKNPATALADNDDGAVRYDGGLYYDPSSTKAQDLIVNGVREVVKNYDVDGVHFDDYFYPTTSPEFDSKSYTAYKAGGGELSLANWRRENVNILMRKVYQAIKEIDPSVSFGISPQGNNENNYNTQYADTAKWLKNEGYVDYICPQIYFGYKNSTAPFESTVKEWNALIDVPGIRLYVGMSPYKIGLTDQWAGEGSNEWVNTTDILSRMVTTSRDQSHYAGFAMFRYNSLFAPDSSVKQQVQSEVNNLKQILS